MSKTGTDLYYGGGSHPLSVVGVLGLLILILIYQASLQLRDPYAQQISTLEHIYRGNSDI